jgi:FkbM family methyltransferase
MLTFTMKTLQWGLIPEESFKFKSADDDPYLQNIENNHESELIFFIKSLMGSDYSFESFLDIGANLGLKCIPASLFFKNAFAVEANAKVFEYLKENIALNQRKNIHSLNIACGSESKTVKFNQNSAWGHVDLLGEDINCLSLNDLCDEINVTRINFCKIDVEGYESKILTNFDFMRAQIDLLWVEFNSWCLMAFGGSNPEELLRYLTDNYLFIGQIMKIENDVLEVKSINSENYKAFLYEHIFQNGCVDDLLLVSDNEIFELIQKNHKLTIV